MQPIVAGNTYQTFHNGTELDDGNDSGDDLATAGDGRLGIDKRKMYEPETWRHRAKRVIFSPRGACYIAVGVFLGILLVALIAAFARPYTFCSCPVAPNKTVVASSNILPVGGVAGPQLPPIVTTIPPAASTPPTTAKGEPFPWDDIRLPANVVPSAYDMFVHPNLTTFRHDGSINITFRVSKPTNFLVLHSRHLNLSNIYLVDSPSNNVTKLLVYSPRDQLYVEFAHKVLAARDHVLAITFTGELRQALNGFYLSFYKTAAGEKRYLATTHFEPTYARMAFPCFDEPSLKATFRVSIARDSEHISLSNMPRNFTSKLVDGLLVDHFDESLRMSTYLVAYIVCDFANVSTTTADGVKVSIFAQRDQIQQATFALEAANKSLNFYNSFFGISYPLPKQDLVALPDFGAGAMENWGLTTYREAYILVEANETSLGMQQQALTTITHELAHQWFGDLVTMKWWNDLWLNEGFATFMEYIGADVIRPDWKMLDQFILEVTNPALQLDSLVSSHPISVEVNDPSDIESIFDFISYRKGAAIMYMLQDFLGMTTLKKGLNTYLNAFNYSNARTEDLWQVLSEESSKMNSSVNVSEVMDTWTQQMGFPVVTISRKGDTIFATQQRFVIGSTNINTTAADTNPKVVSKYGYKWRIPLTCITNKDPHNKFLKWMHLENISFEVDSGVKWIKCNVDQKGFYRINYDDEMWQKLMTALKTNHTQFSAADRASLMDDAFTLSRNNQLNVSIPMEMAKYLSNETEYVPVLVTLQHLYNIHANVEERPCYKNLEKFMYNILDPLVKKLGFKDVGSHMERLQRPGVILAATKLGNKEMIDRAVKAFQDWRTNGTRIPVQMRSVVYGTGIRHGDYNDWLFLWDYYQKTLIPSEKSAARGALGKSSDPWVLSQLLEYSLQKDKIRQQDTGSVLNYVSNNPIGRDLTWRFLRRNWKEIVSRFGQGSFAISDIITDTTRRFSTSFDYEEVKTFFANVEVGSGKRTVENCLEKIETNIKWLEHNEHLLERWLKEQVD